MSQKFTSTIAGASIFISLLGLVSRGLGFFREMIFAYNFGLETEFDLYLVGAVLPITINTIILYIGQNYFIPEYQKKYATDPEEAQKYFKQSFIAFTLAGILLATLLYLTGNIIINFYMHTASLDDRLSAANVFNIFLITIPFSASISILSALLQSVYEFKYPAFAILFLNVSIILMLILFSDRFGVYIIPVGYLIGTILQFGYLLYNSGKFVRINFLNDKFELKQLKSIVNSSILIIILIESMSQLYSIFDRYFYGEISSGGIASLNYAFIIWFLPISIFSISLATAIFPIITKAINNELYNEIEKIYNENISINTFLFIPMTFILFFYGDTIVKIFFERGKFISESTEITFNVLKFYSLGLVFYAVYAVFNKIFYSIDQAKVLMLVTIVGVLIKLIFNFILVDMHQDGLALSTSISFIFFFFASYIILNIKLKIKDRTLFVKEFFFQLVNCLICFIVVKIVTDSFLIDGIFGKIFTISLFLVAFSLTIFIVRHTAVNITTRVFKRLNLISVFKSS
jgi:putative peptidoglycan lipid II flippase